MNTPTIRVSLAFNNGMPDNDLITFSRNVQEKLYTAGVFVSPPVLEPALIAAIDGFSAAKTAQADGGKQATAVKNNKRNDLLVLMKQLALYVQIASTDDLAVMLSSGFLAASTSRARYPLAKPTILKITNGMSGESLVTMSKEKVARGCEVRVAEVSADGTLGEFRPPVFDTSSRNIVVADLIPGKLYGHQARTLGGSTTYSDWSDIVVQRAA